LPALGNLVALIMSTTPTRSSPKRRHFRAGDSNRVALYQKMLKETESMPTPEEIVIAVLQTLNVPYELIDIDPSFADTAAFCEKYGYPVERSCNTIIVASKKEPKRYVACVVLAHTRLDVNKRVTKLMGVSKASFASAEEMITLTGMQVGGVTPFSLPGGVPLYIDDRIMMLDWIILGGGGRSLKIKTSPAVFPMLGGQVVSGLAM
jgi:prolyl-tRNA editing enzyme YbaK/EbsC (Cys-tRNA(Pro) deacylase)